MHRTPEMTSRKTPVDITNNNVTATESELTFSRLLSHFIMWKTFPKNQLHKTLAKSHRFQFSGIKRQANNQPAQLTLLHDFLETTLDQHFSKVQPLHANVKNQPMHLEHKRMPIYRFKYFSIFLESFEHRI